MTINNMHIEVTKRNNKTEKINVDKINKSVMRACDGIEDVSASEIVLDAAIQLYDKIKTADIDKALVMSAKSKIEKDPNYSYVAARLLLGCLYKEVFSKSIAQKNFISTYKQKFIDNLKILSADDRLNSELLTKFNLDTLADAIKPERDNKFHYMGIQTLVDRYFLRHNGKLMETPQAFFMRVAMGMSLKEKNPEEWAINFYNEISQFNYMVSTPTLFNSGTKHSQLSSCYLSTMGDSEDGIMGTIHDQARLSKYAGGLGVDVTAVRGSMAKIKGTDGKSSGPIPFLKILNNTVLAFDQGGGKRKGSCAVYMEPWHLDYEAFLDLRKNTGDDRLRCHDLHTASWIPDLFMQKVENNEDWYLFCSGEFPELHEKWGDKFEEAYYQAIELAKAGKVRYKIVNAKELMKKILKAVFETGHPWFTFKDAANRCYMQKDYVIHNTNLCTEIFRHNIQTQYDGGQKTTFGETAVCNLASINLKEHICYDEDKNWFDWAKLAQTVKIAVRGLDNVIDNNYYPIYEAKKSNMAHRPIGLGIMGFADLLHRLQIPYDSDGAVLLAEDIQQFIYYYALKTSCELAQEKGKFETFDRSEWAKGIMHHDLFSAQIPNESLSRANVISSFDIQTLRESIKAYGLRNANVSAIAPTATISYIVGCSQSIEPDFNALFVYSTLSGEFTMINEWFVKRAKELGVWNEHMLHQLKLYNGDVKHLDIPEEIKQEFKVAFDIDYKYLIDCASVRQKWIDMGQSFNLYCNIPSLKRLYDIYIYAWKKGLKSTYYLRSEGASKVEKTTVEGNILQNQCSIEAARRGEVCESCQ